MSVAYTAPSLTSLRAPPLPAQSRRAKICVHPAGWRGPTHPRAPRGGDLTSTFTVPQWYLNAAYSTHSARV